LKLNVGLTKKVGLPDYGSLGASVHVEVELDSALLQADLEGFHSKVRQAFVACSQAVKDELYRQQAANHQAGGANDHSGRNGDGHSPRRNGSARATTRKATVSQARALGAIAARQQFDLGRLLGERFSVRSPQELTITQASELIDELNGQASQGGR
jgi:hypothetical protein